MKFAIKIALQPVSYTLIAAAFIVTILPASIVALPFPLKTRTMICYPFWQVFSRFVIHVATLSKVTIKDERPLEEQKKYPQGLYIANHQSFIDIPLIITKLPIPPIMKKEVLYIPLVGICGYAGGAMIVDRKSGSSRKKVFEQARQRLTTGLRALQFYPEGTRQKGVDFPKDYSEIKKPIIRFAYEQGIPVYCVSLYGTRKVLNSKSAMLDYGKHIGMIIRSAKRPSDYANADDFMRACWASVTDGYRELQEKLT